MGAPCFLFSILNFLVLISYLREIGWPSLFLVVPVVLKDHLNREICEDQRGIFNGSSDSLLIHTPFLGKDWPPRQSSRLPACEVPTSSELSTGRISGKKKNLSYTLETLRFFSLFPWSSFSTSWVGLITNNNFLT